VDKVATQELGLGWALGVAQGIRTDLSSQVLPAEEGEPASAHRVLPQSITLRTKNYVERIAEQMNESYERGCYDACLVMMRRLVETLIIECFEAKSIADRAKSDGHFMMLNELVEELLKVDAEPGLWNLNRKCKEALPKIKKKADMSAHARTYLARRNDVDNIKDDLRIVVEDLVHTAGIQRPRRRASD
jgi:hypothetical protein